MLKENKKDEPLKVEVVSPTAAEVPEDEKKVLQAQADQLYGKANEHAPIKPTRLDYELNGGIPSPGAPPAQGPNLSKEEEEFAANAGKDKVPPEKTPANKG